jgi:nucleoid-associated protein YejK
MGFILVEYYDDDHTWLVHGRPDWTELLDGKNDREVIDFMRGKGYEYEKEYPADDGITFKFKRVEGKD